jgi:phosphotriesterase-related protein
VQTTAGPLDPDALGLTLVHEHLRVRSDSVAAQFPHLYDEQREHRRAAEQVRAVVARGVRTICDPTVMELGRDVRFMAGVAAAAGVQLVVATGIYTDDHLPSHLANRGVDHIADLFVHDIEEGIQGTVIRAAFIKCCTDRPGVTRNVEKVLRAAARAHLRTGRPIMTHSEPRSETGLEQMRIFLEEGADPARVLIGHTGDTDDLDYIERVLDTGAFIGMDRYGLDMLLPTDRRNATVVELIRRGHAERMMLSQDSCCTVDWYDEHRLAETAPNWTMTYLLDAVVPALREAGVSDDELDRMMRVAPRRWLAGA